MHSRVRAPHKPNQVVVTQGWLAVVLVAMCAIPSAAQTPETTLGTPAGHTLSVNVGHYKYVEPQVPISIQGPRIGGEYAVRVWKAASSGWFLRAHARGSVGRANYDGYCLPYLIAPDSRSANGYALGFGPASACTDAGAADWNAEGRGLVGKDFFTARWGFSPETGLGWRYLSSGLSDVPGYRTDRYLYLPLGLTARRQGASRGVLSLNIEYDSLLRGWQNTWESKLGGGDMTATATAPAFTVNGLTDLAFVQRRGWAVRAGAKYQVRHHWSIEPSYIRWSVEQTAPESLTATFTVNGITADQEMGALEPDNTTDEFTVSVGFHF